MMLTILLILSVLVAFILMTKAILSQEVAMALVALIALILAGNLEGSEALKNGVMEFARIAILFTAVAVPAHILQRSNFLNWVGLWVGEIIGKIHIKLKINLFFLVPAISLLMVYLMAALFHNTTSILVSSLIIYVICRSYQIKGVPVLAGALVASNLGGFSTRWGDTPNIIESNLWNLSHWDFTKEILPLNLVALLILIMVVSLWVFKSEKKPNITKRLKIDTTFAMVNFKIARRNLSLDKRLVLVGFLGLIVAIIGPLLLIQYELLFSALAIILCVVFDYSDHRSQTLLALGIKTYTTLASIFILAQVIGHSSIGVGGIIENWLIKSNMSIWSIVIASYFGTLLTEAASWASAAAPIIHAQSTSHISAWALGSGIFCGSSSLVTAASAGIILTQETQNYTSDSKITFGKYVFFGLSFSAFLMIFYSVILSVLYS